MPSASIAALNIKLNADPRGLLNGFSTATTQARTLSQTFKQVQSELAREQARGREITLSVRTPKEVLQNTLTDLRRLRADGAISFDTFNRAAIIAKNNCRQLVMAGLEPVIAKAKMLALAGAAAFAGFIGWGVKIAGENEMAETSFAAMLKSGEKAKHLMADMKAMGAATPFEFSDFRTSAQALIGAEVPLGDMIPTLSMLGDIAAGSGKNLTELAVIFGQVKIASRLTSQDLNQFTNAMIPLMRGLQDHYGKTAIEIRKMAEAGSISFETVALVLSKMNQQGGIFFGQMEKKSKTLIGTWSTLKDEVKMLAEAMGQVLVPALIDIVKWVTSVVKIFSSFDQTTVKVVLGVTAFIGAMAGTAYAISKVIQVMQLLIGVERAYAVVRSVSLALMGPKGWAILAGAAGAAAIGIALVNREMGKSAEKTKKAAEDSARLAAEMKKVPSFAKEVTDSMGEAADTTADKMTKAKDKADELREAMRELERTMERGKQIALEMRTPEEQYVDTIKDLRSLLDIGAIGDVTFSRATAKAASDFQNAKEQAAGLRAEVEGIGAATRDSTAGFSAIHRAMRESQAELRKQFNLPDVPEQKKMEEKQNEANAILKDIAKNTRETTMLTRDIARKNSIEVTEVNI